jgi:hypothetical protein
LGINTLLHFIFFLPVKVSYKRKSCSPITDYFLFSLYYVHLTVSRLLSMTPTKAFALLLWAAAASTTTASASFIQAACSEIAKQVPKKLFYPQDDAYGFENTDYYNIALTALMPACIFQPTEATEVAAAVKILNQPQYKDVPFAIKSGGHDPNKGHSSVKGGVLLALSKMAFVEYDSAQNVAQFGPGGHWDCVIAPLDKQNVTVLGGRLGR